MYIISKTNTKNITDKFRSCSHCIALFCQILFDLANVQQKINYESKENNTVLILNTGEIHLHKCKNVFL